MWFIAYIYWFISNDIFVEPQPYSKDASICLDGLPLNAGFAAIKM